MKAEQLSRNQVIHYVPKDVRRASPRVFFTSIKKGIVRYKKPDGIFISLEKEGRFSKKIIKVNPTWIISDEKLTELSSKFCGVELLEENQYYTTQTSRKNIEIIFKFLRYEEVELDSILHYKIHTEELVARELSNHPATPFHAENTYILLEKEATFAVFNKCTKNDLIAIKESLGKSTEPQDPTQGNTEAASS